MASRVIKLIGVAVAGACIALAVVACGGGSSSATGSAGAEAAKTVTNTTRSTTDAGRGSVGGEQTNGNPESGSTKAQRAGDPVAEIKFVVPRGLTTANTCKGQNKSPAVSWRNIPPDTAELMIFVVNLKPVKGTLYFDWAITGVDPSLSGLKAGEVPQGAVLGRTGAGKNGYSLCPKGSAQEDYIFSVYAIPKSLSPKQGFEPLAMRNQAGAAAKAMKLTNALFPR